MEKEMPFVKDFAGKAACVLGSGDNEVAFALAGMGSRVTSVDISEEQLRIAEERASILELKMVFLRADVTDLTGLQDDSFDLVYTGGHISVWISDIKKYYSEAVRILRPGGRFVVNDYHPIRRMWLDGSGPKPLHRYFNRGPYEYKSDEGLPTFEYHWTVTDHIQAVLDSGCRVVRVDEHGEKIPDQFGMVKANQRATIDKLPAYLLIVGEKDQ